MTTDEMIEVMARALWEAQCDHWGKYRDRIPVLVAWDDLTHSKRNELKREARAALAAILPVLREVAAKECRVETYEGDRPAHIKPRCQAAIRARFDQIAKEIEG